MLHVWRMLTGYRRVVKWAQHHVRGFLRDTFYDVWPWALALTGFKVQTGQLPLRAAPLYALKLSSLPAVAVSKFAGHSWRFALRLLRRAGAWPLVKVVECLTKLFVSVLGHVRENADL